MDTYIVGRNPLDDFSFDDLESEVDKECIEDVSLYHTTANNEYTFSVKHNFGKLSNRRKAPIFALVDWNGNEIFDLRYWKDNGAPVKGMSFTMGELITFHAALEKYNFSATYDTPIRQYQDENCLVTFFCLIARVASYVKKNTVWYKEVNLVDWGCGTRVDLRKWSSDYKQHSRGVRISLDELKILQGLIKTVVKEATGE